MWRAEDPQGDEARKIRHLIVPYTRGKGLDLGCGPFKAWPHFVGVDNFDEWRGYADPRTGEHWRPDIDADCLDLEMFADASLEFCFSSHLLEHIEDTEAALREWWRVIKPEGHLVLYLPDKTLYPNIGEEGSNPDHKHDFEPQDIIKIMKRIGGWNLLERQRRNQDMEYSFFLVFQKREDNRHQWDVRTERMKKGKKTCLVTRYGGFGDMIQASSVFPQLRKAGYWVVLNTTPRGYEICKNDPNVDDFWIQDQDQVPNDERLDEYWRKLGAEFDHAINFSEVIEETLLAMPGSRRHALSKAARHATMNVNYLEFHHHHAQVPFQAAGRFYPTEEERQACVEFRATHGPAPMIMYSASGTSVHKVYHWVDQLAVRILEQTDAKLLIVGNEQDQVIERAIMQVVVKHFAGRGFEESDKLKLAEMVEIMREHFGGNRILCSCGKWGIRQVLAMCEYVDLIIGPETGVLNAAGLLPTPKICLLSHSTVENLTKHWQNAVAAAPEQAECYPCHRMHYNRDFCPTHEGTGCALCQALIHPQDIFDLVLRVIPEKEAAA